MAISVSFYSLSKRENSTKRPTGSGHTEYCNLKDGCGIIAPVIEIEYSGSPADWNYAYISDFDRYYWVGNWTYYRGLWSAELQVDVLASWKNTIGNSTQYVLRSSHSVDRKIQDNLYPAKAEFTYHSANFSNPFVTSLSAGCFALKVVNNMANAGPMTYLLSESQFNSFMSYLYSTIDWAQISTEEISTELQKGLINPFQYIVSCAWLPLPISSVWGGSQNIRFGYWDSGISAKSIPLNAAANGDITVGMQSHPQNVLRGEYLNIAPFTRRSIYFPVVGIIPLDTTMLSGATQIKLSWHVDMCSGEGSLEIYAITSSGAQFVSHLVNVLKYQAGVPIAVSQLKGDILGGIAGAVGAVGSIASAFMGDVAGGIAGGISGIGNAVQSMIPQPQTNGSTGSFADYFTESIRTPKIVSQFATLVDDDNDDRGRPLCKKVTLSSVPGYIMVADPDIAISGTSEENSSIKTYMAGGFFYE